MGRTDDLELDEDAIDDSGFNEEEEHFELATENLEYDATIRGGTNSTSLEKDEKNIGPSEKEEDNVLLPEEEHKASLSY